MTKGPTSNSPRILICRLSHIGDCVLTLPMLDALRQRWPAAYIAWAMESPTPKLMRDHPGIDEIIHVPRGWLKSLRTILRLRRELRQRHFDIAIDPQSLTKSSALGWFSGAAVRLGFAGKHGRELSGWLNNRRVTATTDHLVDRSVELLQGLAIKQAEPQFHLPVNAEATEFAARAQGYCHLAGQPWVVINPGASWPSKRWENERFAEVATRLHRDHGLPALITWAGQAEHVMAEDIVERSAGAARMSPATDLPQLAALLSAARLFIGCDTGPLHMAAAVGTTCVGLYGPTRPQDSGAWGPQHIALQNVHHAGTSRERRNTSNAAMRTITVDQVVKACQRAVASMDRVTATRDTVPHEKVA